MRKKKSGKKREEIWFVTLYKEGKVNGRATRCFV